MSNEDKTQEYYANIIDSVGDGVIVTDLAGTVTLMNPAAEEITGVSRRTAQGKTFASRFAAEETLIEMVDYGQTISEQRITSVWLGAVTGLAGDTQASVQTRLSNNINQLFIQSPYLYAGQ